MSYTKNQVHNTPLDVNRSSGRPAHGCPDGRGISPPASCPPLGQEDAGFVQNCVEQIVVAMRHYGYDDTRYKLRFTLQHWYRCAEMCGDVVKFVKWKFAAYYASHASHMGGEPQEIPPPPDSRILDLDDPSVLVGGKGYRFLNRLRMKEPEKFTSWLQTVLFLKKGCPRPSDDYLQKSVVKAVKTLTTKVEEPRLVYVPTEQLLTDGVDWGRNDPATDFRLGRSYMTVEMMMIQLRRTVNEVLGSNKYTELDRIKPFFPSTSANYINSRSGGGAVGFLFEKYPELFQSLRQKWGRDKLVKVTKRCITLPNGQGYDQKVIVTGSLRSAFAEMYGVLKNKAGLEPPVVVPVGLKEALKVRVISKGPPLKYTVLKPLQKFLWRCVRRTKPGVLVGEPVSHWSIQNALGAKLADGQRYLSVDYSDATNQMYSWVTEALVIWITEKLELDSIEARIFEDSLINHVIVDPVTKEHKLQQRGQLMGSVVSFPLLCMVNMTLLRMTKEYELGRPLSLDECGCLVNGDDGVLRTTDMGYRYWQMIANFVGLEPSVGKVYFSSKFLNMNSRTFLRRETAVLMDHEPAVSLPIRDYVKRESWFELVPFVNLGLLYGIERSSGGETNTSSPLTSIATRAHDMISCAPEYSHVSLLRQYMSIHRNQLQDFKLPYFLPSHLGGLGLPVLSEKAFSYVPTAERSEVEKLLKPDESDLRLAAVIWHHPDIFKMPAQAPANDWKTWSQAQRLARKLGMTPNDEEINLHEVTRLFRPDEGLQYVSNQTLMSYLVVEALFLSKSLADLYQSVPEKRKTKLVHEYYDAVRKVVKRVRTNTEFPLGKQLPLSLHKFPSPRVGIEDLPVYPMSYAPLFSFQVGETLEDASADEISCIWRSASQRAEIQMTV